MCVMMFSRVMMLLRSLFSSSSAYSARSSLSSPRCSSLAVLVQMLCVPFVPYVRFPPASACYANSALAALSSLASVFCSVVYCMWDLMWDSSGMAMTTMMMMTTATTMMMARLLRCSRCILDWSSKCLGDSAGCTPRNCTYWCARWRALDGEWDLW